jgi:hypothetical protein
MKFSPFFAPCAVLLVIAYNQTFAGASENVISTANAGKAEHIAQLSETCHQAWQELDWTLGESEMPANEHPAFNKGIMRICQARAELFFEGYEITPFIEADSQSQVFPIVFASDVDEIKAHIRQNLPKLRLI